LRGLRSDDTGLKSALGRKWQAFRARDWDHRSVRGAGAAVV